MDGPSCDLSENLNIPPPIFGSLLRITLPGNGSTIFVERTVSGLLKLRVLRLGIAWRTGVRSLKRASGMDRVLTNHSDRILPLAQVTSVVSIGIETKQPTPISRFCKNWLNLCLDTSN